MTISNRDLKLKKISTLKNEMEIHTLLRDLLLQMNFQNIRITHEKGNKPEFGKDLVASLKNNTEDYDEWYAFVVKKGDIKGNALAIAEVKAQVEQCFEHKIKTVELGSHSVNKIRVITNGHLSSGARDTILDSKIIEKGNVQFWDGEKLIELIEKYYPSYWYSGDIFYERYIKYFLRKLKNEYSTKIISISDEKAEKLINAFISPKLIEYSQDEEGKLKNTIHSADSIIKIPENSIVTGTSGSGKTTLFRKLAIEIIEQNSLRDTKNLIPVLIKFIDITVNRFNLKDTLIEHFKIEELKDTPYDIEEFLQTGSIILFIDALDEIAKHELKINALESINEFKADYPNVKIYCTSRPIDSLVKKCYTLGFTYYHLASPTDHQVEFFINEYFGEDVIRSSRLLSSLKDSEILNKLPKTPLTLSLITILFDEKQIEIPATISNLYEYFVDLMLGKLNPKTTIDIITFNVKHRLLSLFAISLHKKEKQSIPLDDFDSFITDYSVKRGLSTETINFREQLIDGGSLLYINDRNEIQFKHLSFQEYFTAVELFQYKSESKDDFINKFNNPWWQNVIIFYAGMSTDSPQLVDKILKLDIEQDIESLITYTSGIGLLLQALYNTPLEIRKEGILKSMEGVVNLYKLGALEIDKEDSLLYKFSKFNLLGIFERWFNMYHKSLSLISPIKSAISTLKSAKCETEEEKFFLDYQRLIGAFVCASKGYEDYELLDDLLKNRLSNDASLFALTDTLFKYLGNKLDKYDKHNPEYKEILERLDRRRRKLNDVLSTINKPLNEMK